MKDLRRYATKLRKMCELAGSVAELGTDPRGIRVGACVFPADCSGVWFGYNGAARGLDHGAMIEAGAVGEGCSGMAHAEANALIKAGRGPHAGGPLLLATTLMPCPYCAPLVVNAGVKGVIYAEEDPKQRSGRPVLEAGGLKLVHSHDVDSLSGWFEPWGGGVKGWPKKQDKWEHWTDKHWSSLLMAADAVEAWDGMRA